MPATARLLAILVLLLGAVTLRAPAAGAMGLKEEKDLGARFALEARRRLPLIREPAVTAYLRRVAQRIIAHLDTQEFDYRFYVVREPTLNAFAVPGGYVYVHAGLPIAVHGEAHFCAGGPSRVGRRRTAHPRRKPQGVWLPHRRPQP